MLCPSGPLGEDTRVRKLTTVGRSTWWWEAGSQPVWGGPACDAALLSTWLAKNQEHEFAKLPPGVVLVTEGTVSEPSM